MAENRYPLLHPPLKKAHENRNQHELSLKDRRLQKGVKSPQMAVQCNIPETFALAPSNLICHTKEGTPPLQFNNLAIIQQ